MQEKKMTLNDLLSFATELDGAFRHRDSGAKQNFVFDTNVIWALHSDAVREGRESGSHTERALGATTAHNLMLWSVQNFLQDSRTLNMLSPHKKEIDIALFDRHNWEYRSLVDALTVSIETAKARNQGKAQEIVVEEIVKILRQEFEGTYYALADATRSDGAGEKSTEIADFASKTTQLFTHNLKKLSAVENLKLDYRLEEVQWVLRSDYNRSTYSIKQDIKALRELAVINYFSKEKTILLTLDKRLVDAVRLTSIWAQESGPDLPIESFDTFWIWLLETHSKGDSAIQKGSVRQIMDEFRYRVRTMFLRYPDDTGQLGFWPASHNNFDQVCSEKFKNIVLSDSSDEQAEAFNDFVNDTSEVLENAEKSTYPESEVEQLHTICSRFFSEVNDLVTMLRISSNPQSDNSKKIQEALNEANLSVEGFLSEIQTEISEHAHKSLRILGTGTIFAPRVLQAIGSYLSYADKRRQTGQEFVYRLPLPIQSDEFDLREVLKLVSEEGASQKTRFERLLDREIRSGPIADLLIAYFLVHAGDWDEARRICEASRRRSTNPLSPEEPVLFETFLLEAEILRIYQTNRENLDNARKLLESAKASDVLRPQADSSDVRIRLELCAVKVNQILITFYHMRSLNEKTQLGSESWIDETLHELFVLRSEILDRGDRGKYLGSKLLANINTHILLLTSFNEDSISRLGKFNDEFVEVLQQGNERVDYQRRLRVSSFEKVIVMYGIYLNSRLIDLDETRKLRLRDRLRRRLGSILQRKAAMTHFEFWIFQEIHRAL